MKKAEKKDIHLLGIDNGYELGKVLPQSGLASRLVINRFLKEQIKAYKLGLVKGIEQQRQMVIKGRERSIDKDKSFDNSLTNFKIHYGPDHDMEN